MLVTYLAHQHLAGVEDTIEVAQQNPVDVLQPLAVIVLEEGLDDKTFFQFHIYTSSLILNKVDLITGVNWISAFLVGLTMFGLV